MDQQTGAFPGVAVVTGGSKGIGRAISLSVAEMGFKVAIFDVLAEAGRKVVDEIERRGGTAGFWNVDVSNEEQVGRAAQAAAASLGPVSVLVNNAGIYPRGTALEMSFDNWMRVIRVNLGGAYLCSRAVAPGMLAAGGGVIVNIASGRGLQGTPRGSHYAASKAGIISLTRSLALEWAPHIRVNTVIPGITDTDQPREDSPSDEELYSRGKRIPLGRIGQPEDIAKAVCYMISDKAGYVTGQSLCVNGGAIMI